MRPSSRLPFAAALIGLLLAGATCISADEPALTPQLNLPYKESTTGLTDYETTRCKLDLYAPAGSKEPLPVIVWFHGGGITGGDKGSKDTAAVAARLAQDGFLVASVNYRLSPKATYPAYLEDAAAAVAWVLKNAAAHGGDPKRVFVAGHSAGGYLTTMLALDARYLGRHNLKPEDIRGYIPVAGQMITHAAVRAERGIEKGTMIVDEAAPLHHVRKDIPPMLILYAEKDMAMRAEENRFFAEALTSAGCKSFQIQQVDGHDHGGVGNRMADADDTGRAMMIKFIREQLK
ncbi:alpha/beta hydrolase [Verrucomicrobium sp. BvORR106]|uniref:alpha/beta hydrolase n=1 Tax=Verrucomicrobium sp. BvORR106 TaxID=1403819 RepID=UPI00057017E8|nr:alpha/beta hydrolase [Verrucomicrobium sp. BvORR106]